MTPFLHDVTLWSAAAADALLASVWQGLLLSTLIVVCFRCLPNFPAAGRSLVWMSTFLLTVMLQITSFFPDPLALPQRGRGTVLHIDSVWSLALAAAWALLSLARGTRLLLSAYRLHSIAAEATPVACISGPFAWRGLRRPVALCTSLHVDRPSVIGFFSPRILLPPTLFQELSNANLEQVVLHEMEHLRRRDDWTNLGQKLILALFPLNPVLLWIEHRLCIERELACDDSVLRSTKARKSYAACLATLAEHSIVSRAASLALGAWERQSELARRVHRILRHAGPEMASSRTAILTSLLVAAIVAGSATLARMPQLVHFSALPTSAQLEPSRAPSPMPEPAVYRSSAPPNFLKAMLLKPQASRAAVTPALRRASSGCRRVKAQDKLPLLLRADLGAPADSSVQGQSRTRLVARSRDLQMDRPVAAGMKVMQVSYAAIPLINGWLIIQL